MLSICHGSSFYRITRETQSKEHRCGGRVKAFKGQNKPQLSYTWAPQMKYKLNYYSWSSTGKNIRRKILRLVI